MYVLCVRALCTCFVYVHVCVKGGGGWVGDAHSVHVLWMVVMYSSTILDCVIRCVNLCSNFANDRLLELDETITTERTRHSQHRQIASALEAKLLDAQRERAEASDAAPAV